MLGCAGPLEIRENTPAPPDTPTLEAAGGANCVISDVCFAKIIRNLNGI